MRPRVVLKAATSLNGVLDDSSAARLILSTPQDADAVDALRAQCDAILVGAETLRKDNPKLLVRDAERVACRVAAGRSPQPIKVTLTRSGLLPAEAAFFTAGDGDKVVYIAGGATPTELKRSDVTADLVNIPASETVLPSLLADLAKRGVRVLLVEGGAEIHRQFILSGLFDELRLAISPQLVDSANAVRLILPNCVTNLRLDRVEMLGQMTILHLVPELRSISAP